MAAAGTSDAATAEVVRLMRRAAARCLRVMRNPSGRTENARTFVVSRAAQQLAGLNRELDAIGGRVGNVAAAGIAAAYRQGLVDGEAQATAAGVRPAASPLAGAFSVIDRRRAGVLADQTVNDLRKSIVSMRDTTGKIVRQTQALNLDTRDVNRLLAGESIEGRPRDTLRQLREMMRTAAVDGKIVTVNAKTGVVMHFKPDAYADLVMQTKAAETATAALMERFAARGVPYVKVIGSNSRNFCTAFVGRVFYIGPGEDPTGQYPSNRRLPRGGPPFHPKCTKRFVAFNPKLATPAQRDDAKLRPHEREFLGLDSNAAGRAYRRQRAAEAAAKPKPPVAAGQPADDPVSVLAAVPGEPGERIIGPADLLANAKEFLARQTRDWAAQVTPAEADAVGRYQSYGTGYRRINGFLRTGKVDDGVDLDKLRQTIAGMDSAISKGGVPFDLPVARAIRGTDQLLDAWRSAVSTHLPWTEYGYCSTSLAERGAEEFWGKTARPVMFTFRVPALTPFAYPAGVTSAATHQLELLLDRGHKFRILQVRKDGKITRVEAEMMRDK